MNDAFNLPYIKSINSSKIAVRLAKYKKNIYNNLSGELQVILTSNSFKKNLNFTTIMDINIPNGLKYVSCSNNSNNYKCFNIDRNRLKCKINITSFSDTKLKLYFRN